MLQTLLGWLLPFKGTCQENCGYHPALESSPADPPRSFASSRAGLTSSHIAIGLLDSVGSYSNGGGSPLTSSIIIAQCLHLIEHLSDVYYRSGYLMCYWQIVTSHYQTVISFVLKETVRGYWLTKKNKKLFLMD